jgi:hypothetical protein
MGLPLFLLLKLLADLLWTYSLLAVIRFTEAMILRAEMYWSDPRSDSAAAQWIEHTVGISLFHK